MKITKAVITAAGRGTRFLPVSSAYQKEMVPILNKPQLQYVIEEAIEAGIEEIVVVNREGVDTFANYLQHDDELWKFLRENGKEAAMDSWTEMRSKAEITVLTQKSTDPYGNGTPFTLAKDFVNGDSFIGMWGDDITVKEPGTKLNCTQQMMEYYEKYSPVAVMSVEEVAKDEISRYGCFGYDEKSEIPYHAIELIEKPEPEDAPSLMANTARFALDSVVIDELMKNEFGKDGELWLTDAVKRLLHNGSLVIAPPCKGCKWMPTGDPLRWLKANILIASKDPEMKREIIGFTKEL